MERIALVTDSTCDIPPEHLAELGIHMIPLSVYFGDEEYRDNVDLTPEQFYAKLAGTPDLPTTSQPSAGQFHALYQKLQQDGYTHILSLHLTRKFSGTLQAAAVAARMLTGVEVQVEDSRSASWGLGLQVLRAKQLIDNGMTFAELVPEVRRQAEETLVVFTIDSLDALQRGGRIGKAAAWFGKLLGVRPILALPGSSGEIETLKKVNSHAAAVEAVVELALEHQRKTGIRFGVCVIHSNSAASQNELATALQAAGLETARLRLGRLGAVIGTHLGPSGWGLVLC